MKVRDKIHDRLALARRQAYNSAMHPYTINQPKLWRHLLPGPDASSHKYARGYALIQGGYPITGAAILAALACARIGAGLTAIAVPELALSIYASQLLSIMARPYSDASSLQSLIDDTRIGAFLIGPGSGINDQTRNTTLRMLQTGKPVVIDADALTTLAGQPTMLTAAIRGPCVLTPHAGEFSRLMESPTTDALEDRIAQAQSASAALKAVVVLKGSQTIITAGEGRTIVNQNAPPSLATAGAGDVLAGCITGLLAQGMPAFEAAAAACWIHGSAATLFGTGLIADDLPGLIPNALAKLNASALE